MESEISAAQPREREGSPGPSNADCQGESPKWVEARLGRRGILVGEMVARNDLIVLKVTQ